MDNPERRLTQLSDPAPNEVAGFLCQAGEPEADLQDFLQNAAIDYVRDGFARVYLGWLGSDLIGFFTLSCVTLGFAELSKSTKSSLELAQPKNPVPKIPGVLLGRLAVDLRWRRQGLGTWLFEEAGIVAYGTASKVGCRLLIVDAKHEKIGWYERHGCFLLGQCNFPPETTRMGFDLFPAKG